MPRPPAVSADEVSLACDRLVARGERPSHRLVRLEVGRGSLSTIAEHLHAWQARKAADEHSPGPVDDSIRALEILSPSAASAVREAFRSAAAAELGEARSAAEQARKRAEDLQDALILSEREREDLMQRVETLEQHLGGLRHAIQEMVPAFDQRITMLGDGVRDQVNRVACDVSARLEDRLAVLLHHMERHSELQLEATAHVQSSAREAAAAHENVLEAIAAIRKDTANNIVSIEHQQRLTDNHLVSLQRELSHLGSWLRKSVTADIIHRNRRSQRIRKVVGAQDT